jgi:hypothetical protein
VTAVKNTGENKVLRLRFSRGELEFRLRSEPLIDEHRLWLGVGVPNLGDCEVRITLGERMLGLEPPRKRSATMLKIAANNGEKNRTPNCVSPHNHVPANWRNAMPGGLLK